MRKRIAILSCVLLAASSASLARDQVMKEPTEKEKAQRMKSCNEKAGDRKGAEREKFMAVCLRGG